MKNIENTSIGEEVMESNFKIDFGTITVDEFAKAMGRPAQTVYSWRRNGTIPEECFTQIGKCIYILVEPMKQFLNRSAEA